MRMGLGARAKAALGRKRRIGQIAFASVAAQGATAAAAFLASVTVARALDPQDVGYVALAIVFVGLGSALSNIGGLGVVHFLAEEAKAHRVIISTASLVGIVGGCAGYVVATALYFHAFSDVVAAIGSLPFVLFGLCIPLAVWSDVQRQVELGLGRIGVYSFLLPIRNVLYVATVLLLGTIDALTVRSAVAAYGAGVVASVGATVLCGVRGNSLSIRGSVPSFVWLFIRKSVVLYPATFLNMVNYRIDQVLLGLMRPAADVGRYAVAVGLAESVSQISVALGAVLIGHARASDAATFRSRVIRVSRLAGGITLLSAIAMFFGAPWALASIYGEAYRSSAWVLRFLLPGMIALAVGRTVATEHVVRGRFGVAAGAATLGVVITIVGDLLLIPVWGAVGAAAISSLAYCAGGYVHVRSFRR